MNGHVDPEKPKPSAEFMHVMLYAMGSALNGGRSEVGLQDLLAGLRQVFEGRFLTLFENPNALEKLMSDVPTRGLNPIEVLSPHGAWRNLPPPPNWEGGCGFGYAMSPLKLSPELELVRSDAERKAVGRGSLEITPEHLIWALSENQQVREILLGHGVRFKPEIA